MAALRGATSWPPPCMMTRALHRQPPNAGGTHAKGEAAAAAAAHRELVSQLVEVADECVVLTELLLQRELQHADRAPQHVRVLVRVRRGVGRHHRALELPRGIHDLVDLRVGECEALARA